MKELAAVEVILQFKKVVKPRYNGWYFRFKCVGAGQCSMNLADMNVSYFEVCSTCTWRQWIKKCELPKEVANYCETVLDNWDKYFQDSDLEDYMDEYMTDSENEYTSEDESSENGSVQEEFADEDQGE